MPLSLALPTDIRKLLAFGSGIGIEIGDTDLEVAVARVRPSKVRVLGRLTIENFEARPAAEWGEEYAKFLKSVGMGHLSATVLLPRREVIVRHVTLPGVAAKDMDGALRLQLDTLHPYGEDEIAWGWSAVAPGVAMVGIVRRAMVDRFVQLFTEAGILVSSFTFSAAAVHAAIRLNGAASGEGFIALSHTPSGAVEIYGESAARPVFSAEFDLAPQRAVMLAVSELRLPPDTAPLKLEEVLPKPHFNPIENDLSRNALPYATALAGACPRLTPSANVLPPEYRRFSSRAVFIPTMVLTGLLLAMGGGMAAYSTYASRKYLAGLNAEIRQLEPKARHAGAVERQIEDARARAGLLDQVRDQTRADLDALNDLTRRIEPPAWTSAIELLRDSARLTGEAPQAAPLLKILDSSPQFRNSTMEMDQRSANGESFQIRMQREGPK
jgi:hypothetical protein